MRDLSPVSAVVFDCDSTLTAIEGIDELAVEHRPAIAALTDAAMRGDVALEEVYGRRLGLIRPGRRRLEELAREYVARLVPDAVEVAAALRDEHVEVRIVSGGLLPAVLAVGDALGLAREHVAAVAIDFAEDGSYAGYDETSPLARSGGKCDVLRAWRRRLGPRVMMIGDGATDLEAAEAADVFVAYTGIAERAAVVERADVVIRSQSLAPVLPLATGGAPPRAAKHRPLFERGLALLDARDRGRLTHLNP
ncbi:MAG TPA: HAD-IB family phosphatase [Longimicrobiales bacterium]